MTPRKRARKRSWRVWVRFGVGIASGPFIEDLTQYELDPKIADRCQRATLTLDTPKPKRPAAKIAAGLKSAIAHASGKRVGKSTKITVRKRA